MLEMIHINEVKDLCDSHATNNVAKISQVRRIFWLGVPSQLVI